MAGPYAISYPNRQVAEAEFETQTGLEQGGFLTDHEQALVIKDGKGKTRIDHEFRPVRSGAVTGGVVGAVVGAVFLSPIAGAAVGAALGGIFGKTTESGRRDDFKEFSEAVQEALPNGRAALVHLISSLSRDRVVQNLGLHGGMVHSLDIPNAELATLQAAVDRASSEKRNVASSPVLS